MFIRYNHYASRLQFEFGTYTSHREFPNNFFLVSRSSSIVRRAVLLGTKSLKPHSNTFKLNWSKTL